MKRVRSDLFLLKALPLLAIACLIVLSYDLLPLDAAGDPTIFTKIFVFVAGWVIFSIPICFIGHWIAVLFSPAIRERIRAHKWLDALWVTTFFLIFFLIFRSGHADPNSRGMRAARTRIELAQIYTGILAYETEYGGQPETSSNRALVQILEGKNPRNIPFVIFNHWELNSNGEAIDGWGTPIRISFRDSENPLVQSAGPDRLWSTPDDIIGEKYP